MRFQTILAKKVLEAGEELGFKPVDLNDMMSSDGFMKAQVTAYKGERWSADRALKQSFLKARDNLKIVTNTVVEKVSSLNPNSLVLIFMFFLYVFVMACF